MRYTLERIPSGQAGTDQTVKRLSDLVQESLNQGKIRLLALKILDTAHVRNRDSLAAAKAIYRYVHNKVRYVPDPVGLETIQQPEITLGLKAGDCDDHSALVGALAHSLGMPARFRVIGHDPENFCHIYPELLVNGKWVAADTTNPAGFGKRPPKFEAEKVYSVNGGNVMPRLGEGSRVSKIPTRLLKSAAYGGARKVLVRNWNNGIINRGDLVGYLAVIDHGNSPGRGTFADPAMRQAISDFLSEVDKKGAVSGKASGQMNGMEGLDGFLKSVWSGVKSAVKTAIGVVGAAGIPIISGAAKGAGGVLFPGQQPQTSGQIAPGVTFAPTIRPQAGMIQTQVTPGAARAGVAEFMSSPMFIIPAIAVVAIMFLKK